MQMGWLLRKDHKQTNAQFFKSQVTNSMERCTESRRNVPFRATVLKRVRM